MTKKSITNFYSFPYLLQNDDIDVEITLLQEINTISLQLQNQIKYTRCAHHQNKCRIHKALLATVSTLNTFNKNFLLK